MTTHLFTTFIIDRFVANDDMTHLYKIYIYIIIYFISYLLYKHVFLYLYYII